MDSIKVSIDLDGNVQKSLADFVSKSGIADKGLKKLGDTSKNTFSEISLGIGKSIGVYDIFAGNLAANVVVGAFNSMKDAARGLFDTFIVEGVKAAQESEDALNSLAVALGQTGQYSASTLEEFKKFAETIQETTAVEDDAVIKNAALLASLTNLDKNGLQRATMAAVELSQALGKDLESTTQAIAKAANGNYLALNKMGVQFEKTGTQAGTFQNALIAIEEKLGGTAASKLNTFSGSVAQVKNIFNNLQEEFGNVIIKNPALIAALNSIGKILIGTTRDVGDNQAALKTLVAEGFIAIINTSRFVVQAVGSIATAVEFAGGKYTSFLDKLIPGSEGAHKLLKILGKELVDLAGSAGTAAKEVSPLQKSFLDLDKSLEQISNSAKDGLSQIAKDAAFVGPLMRNGAAGTRDLTEAQKRLNEESNKFTVSLAQQGSSTKNSYDQRLQIVTAFYDQIGLVEEEKDNINYAEKLVREQEFFNAKKELLVQQRTDEQAVIDASTEDPETKNQARLASLSKYHADTLKLEADFATKKKQLEVANRKQEQANNQATVSATGNLFSSLSQLAATGGKKNFAITKALATSAAIINAYAAITKTLADGGPYPANVINAAAIGVSAFAQVANIQSQSPPSFMSGGIVPGTSFTGDKVLTRQNSGEMNLNKSQQAQLFELANGRGQTSDNSELIGEMRALRSAFLAGSKIEIDGKEVFNVLRDGQQSGRRF